MAVAPAPSLAPVRTGLRTLQRQALEPSTGLLQQDKTRWLATQPKVQLTAEADLEPGWYRFQIRLKSLSNYSIHKRLELTFEGRDGESKSVTRDAMEWNRTLKESFLIELPRGARRLTMTLVHAEGEFELDLFRVKRISDRMVGLAAVGEKLRLISAYKCLRPVLWRGSGMLIRGDFGGFHQKVLKGLTDSRVMRLGAYKANEVDASWWRRHALPADEAAAVRAKVDAMAAPLPLAVILPVLPKKFDQARAAAHSIRRQLYPHWELHLVCAGPAWIHTHLSLIIGRDPRVQVHLVDEDDGFGAAAAQALAETECQQVVVLPSSVELSEQALYELAAALKANEAVKAISARVYDAGASAVTGEELERGVVWLTQTRLLSDNFPEKPNATNLCAWAIENSTAEEQVHLTPVLAYPVEENPFVNRSRVGKLKPEKKTPLLLAADLRGITGWDHVTYAVLRGLPCAGVELTRDPIAQIRSELIPPSFLPPDGARRKGQKTLAISPPFIVHRFDPNRDTAVFTMWETDKLTASDVKKLNHAGLIVVPSVWQVECFRNSGITVPMETAPLGFDQLMYHDDGSWPEVCTFGTAGALVAGGLRKNAQKMIDLFRKAFPTETDVRLRVKTSPSSPLVETYDDPRIDLLRAVLPHKELADWYRSLSVYVNGSFGEGFGLHLIEAMACARALITTNYSGLTSYFAPELGYVIPHTLVPVENDVYTGRWAEPSDDGIIAAMRQVYGNQAEARQKGQASASRANLFTWKASGKKLIAALRKHGYLEGQ